MSKIKRTKDRRTKEPVRHVVLSAEDKRAYEELARVRTERGEDYGKTHPQFKPKVRR